jgi:hypothetical protein
MIKLNDVVVRVEDLGWRRLPCRDATTEELPGLLSAAVGPLGGGGDAYLEVHALPADYIFRVGLGHASRGEAVTALRDGREDVTMAIRRWSAHFEADARLISIWCVIELEIGDADWVAGIHGEIGVDMLTTAEMMAGPSVI